MMPAGSTMRARPDDLQLHLCLHAHSVLATASPNGNATQYEYLMPSDLNYMFKGKGNSQFKQTLCDVYVMHAQLQIDLDHRHDQDHELISFRAFC